MPLTSQARADLVQALQPHVAAMAEDLRRRLLDPTPAEAPARAAAGRLHAEERSGEALDVWIALLAHRIAVHAVLKLVWARVLEDRGLVARRLTDPLHGERFLQLAPNLGESAYARWVLADLARPRGGLPELFAPAPAEVLPPADAHTRAVLALLCDPHPDTGARRFDFSDERFDGQLMGDLYQELDPVVKERYALLQTPDFVRAFLLDRTLEPAIAEFGAATVRVIDPACGSGHFLIDAFRRLVQATAAARPDTPRRELVLHALDRVVGLDLNDAAAALARARLLMTAVELLAEGAPTPPGGLLALAHGLRPHVYAADGLRQFERGEDGYGTQFPLFAPADSVPRAALPPPEVRRAVGHVLRGGFHAVLANPPYIVERDEAAKTYHKEKVGGAPRYRSASGKYSLGAPFTERCFQLAARGGFVGLITSNSFAKREFGKKLVEDVLAGLDLSLVVDTSGAYIPGHGTPTVLLFGRNRPPAAPAVTAVLGKRGEPSNPEDPARGQVWQAILAAWDHPGADGEFVSAERVPRATLDTHPWSLRGGGALGLQERLETVSPQTLGELADHAGITAVTGEDSVYVWPVERSGRTGAERHRTLVTGEVVRDWALAPTLTTLWPVDDDLNPADASTIPGLLAYLWRYRAAISQRRRFGTPMSEKGAHWYELQELYADKLRTPLTITFAFVATHNHFALDRGGKVFNRTAPVIKLPAAATEADHLALLGPLNSSAACFWMKQAFFDKGRGGYGGGVASELWEVFFEHDSTKLARFPLPPDRAATLPWARALDALGQARAADTAARVLDDPAWADPAALRAALDARAARDLDRLRQMAALQEELDWLVYRLYALVDPALPVAPPDQAAPIDPGWRPFELRLARALAAGEPTAWFSRHGWDPCPDLPPAADPATAARTAARLAAIEASADLRLLEAPVHKRRWYRPDPRAEEQAALRAWILDRAEEALARAPRPRTPAELARALAASARVQAALALVDGRPDLAAALAGWMAEEAVAAHPAHRYTARGLVKRAAWERTWQLQAAADRGEDPGPIPVPPSYTAADFVGSVAYTHRGKLDVPRERFVAHTEIPDREGRRRAGEHALYGWAGWSRAERVERLLDLLDDLDAQGVPADARVGLHDLLYRTLDELARTAPRLAADHRADLDGEAGGRPTEARLRAWLADHPASPGGRGRRARA